MFHSIFFVEKALKTHNIFAAKPQKLLFKTNIACFSLKLFAFLRGHVLKSKIGKKMILKKRLNELYRKIKLVIFRNMFKHLKKGDESLTSSEYFCLQCIYLLKKPSISELAEFLDISSPNATYKVKTLIKKGLITKEKSEKDGREYLLVPTQKFFDLYESKDLDENELSNFKKTLSKNENKKMEKILNVLMEEV